MKTIAIPTDFSDCANCAVDVGFELAKLTGYKLKFIHVLNTLENYVVVESFTGINLINEEQIFPYFNEQIAEAKRKLALLAVKAQEKGVEVETHLNYTPLYEEMKRLQKESDIYLIIMGSRGARGFEEIFIGSNTQRMVRLSHQPILTLKEPLKTESVQKIVFVSDFDRVESNVESLNTAIDFAAPLKATVEVLFVNTPSYFEDSLSTEDKIEHTLSLSKNPDLDYHIQNDFSIEEGVKAFCLKNHFDLVAISTHGYTGIRRLFNSNITEALVNHLDIPILSIPMKEKDE